VKINPALKTLFMSGYTSNIILEHGVQAEESNFIQKPFTVREFNTKLESLFIP